MVSEAASERAVAGMNLLNLRRGFWRVAGLRGEADAFEFVLVRLPPADLQQTVHVQKGHL